MTCVLFNNMKQKEAPKTFAQIYIYLDFPPSALYKLSAL